MTVKFADKVPILISVLASQPIQMNVDRLKIERTVHPQTHIYMCVCVHILHKSQPQKPIVLAGDLPGK